jgi:amidophosphoribosyltransferase
MCGVLGFISDQPVAPRLLIGADRLQNRGEHSTGVATYDGYFFHHFGDIGSASAVFNGYPKDRLPGNMGIAHTRYATTGGASKELLRRNLQPVGSDRPGLWTCANGDLVNLHSRREELKDRGFTFQTEVDAKVIQNALIESLISNKVHKVDSLEKYVEVLFDSVEELHESLTGAYSCVTMTERGLLVFRDPQGIRPLCMATHKRDEMFSPTEYAFASESSVFNYFGDYHDLRDVKPGEMIFIDRENLRFFSREPKAESEAFCFFEFVYFARPDSRFKGRTVETAREELGRIMAQEYPQFSDSLDVIIGVPGTGLSAAHAFGHELGVPSANAIIKVGNKRSFQEATQEKREKAIDEKFIFIRDFIDGRHVGVIDDSNVRGTTARKIVARLRDLGAKSVHLFYFCPPVVGPCFYGIDTPDEDKLIAFGRSEEEMCSSIGCDSINYISIDGLVKGLQLPQEELCLACVTREYPTDVEEARTRLALRKAERGEKC